MKSTEGTHVFPPEDSNVDNYRMDLLGYKGLGKNAKSQPSEISENSPFSYTYQPGISFKMKVQEYLESTPDKFGLILADPPWKYDSEPLRKSDRIALRYDQMPLHEISSLPVHRITKDKAVLFLWTTAPKLNEALLVMRSWGFQYKTNLAWNKERIGLGYIVRGQHELLLIGKKGKCPGPLYRPPSIMKERRTLHSKKPVISYDIIERMYPREHKIELFARSVYPGWTGVGLEAESIDVEYGLDYYEVDE